MYLIDTSIFVFSLRGDAKIAAHLSQSIAEPRALSVITFGELLCGAMKCNQPAQNVASVRRIGELYPIIDLTPPIIERFAALRVQLEREGQRLDDFDLLIAATALHMRYSLVTSNLRHFSRIPGLAVEDWAE